MKNTYYEERKSKTEYQLEILINELPYFAEEYFIGMETTTSPLTRLGYALDLRIFFDFLCNKLRKFNGLTLHEFTIKHLAIIEAFDIEKFLSYLSNYDLNGKHYSNSLTTKSRKLATIRSFFKYYYNKNKLSENVASKVSMPKLHEKPIIRLESEEVYDMLNVCENTRLATDRQKAYNEKTKLRDTAILSLFLGTGIRISELVGLDLSSFDFYKNSFIVTRKGGNQSILYFNDDVAIALLEYYEERIKIDVKNDDKNAFFLSLQNRRITTRAVQNLVKKYAMQSAPLKHITPHKLRSTFGTNLYRETKDIYVVAEVLGHKDINVTKKHYADISEEIKKEAVSHVQIKENPIKLED